MSEGLRLLGPLELVDAQGERVALSPKERGLLGALAVRANSVVTEGLLVEALWDDTPPRTATATLHTYVLRLRSALRGCEGLAVLTRSPGYVLVTAPEAVDAAVAEALIADGRRALAGGQAAIAARLLADALCRWRGPSLLDVADRPFARTAAARWDELHDTAEEDQVDAELALGRHRDLVGRLEGMVAARPLREHRWSQLLLALYRDGRQADVLAAARRLRTTLLDELGVEPGEELRRLEAAVRRQDESLLLSAPSLDLVAPRAVAPAQKCYGRDDEIGRLVADLADVESGRGGIAFVCGEAGIGKTRLLAELADLAGRRGAGVLSGRCLETGGAGPFHPFVEAVEDVLSADVPGTARSDAEALASLLRPPAPATSRRTIDPLEPALQPDELRLRIFDGAVRLFTALSAQSPLLVIVDDLHWADAGTVALLRHVARAARGLRLLLVGAYRDGEVQLRHPLRDALAELHAGAGCTTLRLSGLPAGALSRLLGDVTGRPLAAGLTADLLAETRGNPFFARELVHHLWEEGALTPGPDGCLTAELPSDAVPNGVRQVIDGRRRRLSAAADALLRAACCIDGPFPFAPVADVAGLSRAAALDALDEVLDSGLVTPERADDHYGFGHALVRHAVYQSLNPSRRLRLHRSLAVELDRARATAPELDPAEVAVQYARSAALPGAAAGVTAALDAAARAGAAGAHEEEAAALRTARRLATPDDERLPGLLAALATALAWSLRFDEAVEVARDAAAHLETRQDSTAAGQLLAGLGTTLAAAGSNRHAWLLASAGLRVSERSRLDPVSRATLTLLDLDRQEADDADNPGIALDAPGRRAALRVLHESGRLTQRGDLSRYAVAAVHGSRAALPPDAADDPTVALYLLGDYVRAAPRFTAEAEHAADRGQLAWEVYCRAGAVRALAALGDLAGAQAALARARALAVRMAPDRMSWQLVHYIGAEDCLAMTLDRGWPERLVVMRQLIRPGVPEHRWGIATMHGITARALARLDRAEEALPLLARPVRALRVAPSWAPNYARLGCDVAETLWLLDRRDHLSVVETALRDKALPADFRFPSIDVRQALGRLCALDGRVAEARQWFAAARTVLEQQQAWPLRAVVDHDEALLHLRRGDRAAALPWLAAAGSSFRRLGMGGWAGRVAGLTAGAGGLEPGAGGLADGVLRQAPAPDRDPAAI